jgi:hypothetical protein
MSHSHAKPARHLLGGLRWGPESLPQPELRIATAPQTVPGTAGQPGKNAGEPAGLTGPGPLPVAADFSSPTSPGAGAEPEQRVQCGFCGLYGPQTAAHDMGGGRWRCADIDPCVQRSLRRPAAPAPAPVAEPLEPLPAESPDPADTHQQASIADLKRWAPGETLADEGSVPEAVPEPPAVTEPAPAAVPQADPEDGGETT